MKPVDMLKNYRDKFPQSLREDKNLRAKYLGLKNDLLKSLQGIEDDVDMESQIIQSQATLQKYINFCTPVLEEKDGEKKLLIPTLKVGFKQQLIKLNSNIQQVLIYKTLDGVTPINEEPFSVTITCPVDLTLNMKSFHNESGYRGYILPNLLDTSHDLDNC